ncbi:GGDEF domain-containing protein [Rhizobium sp. RMa-01]|uniref:GGDEF domain-containing protein n=1 Tax=unclassified Rhizobium TaxID=2613769 RepID=UPI0008D9BBB2|nr:MULTISPECIES: GGDEF domain-containing protein [unclassified Rhizobium]OHV19022.1 diguanylate cyclase [Rhizobium sp. RSm-3]RVU09559.1 GGDEF domain-containing protein [Rhizobium sp. RMa-01]
MARRASSKSRHDQNLAASWQELLDSAVRLDWECRTAEALEMAETAYEAALEAGDIAGALRVSHRLALIHFNKENLAEGLKICLRAETWLRYCQDQAAIISLQSIHGGLLVALGDLETGFGLLIDCQKRTKSCMDPLANWRARTAYAVALFDSKDFDRAAEAAAESLDYAETSSLAKGSVLIARSIASRMAARALGEHRLAARDIDTTLLDRTEEQLRSILTEAQAENLPYEIAECHCYLGLLAWTRCEDAAAAAHYIAAIAACRIAEDDVLMAETSYWYAYLLAGQGVFDEAVLLLAAIEATEAALATPRMKLRHFDMRYRIAEMAGDWRAAFDHHRVYHELVVEDYRRLASARAYTMKLALDLETMRRKEDSARLERERLLEENLRLAAEQREAVLASRTDPLTGLGNRRELQLKCREWAQSSVTHAALMLVDIDHFKRINDVFSHSIGDIVLSRLAALLGDAGAKGGLAIRMGGEEFLLLLPDTRAVDAFAAAERLRLRVQDHEWSEVDPKLDVTCSIGLADWSLADNIEIALQAADANLYTAKNAGRNRCVAPAS